ncbi:IS66 family transposase [Hoeflea sp.]|uniref:IS66 family transposase n=1 Tax=Hoeflea sp. TaxID=1940281 RepID=UPI003B017A40
MKAPVQYGDEIAALAAYLQTQHCIPEDRLARIFSDLYKIRVAPATLASLIAKKADSMRVFADRVRELLSGTAVAVKHLDETGLRIAGKTRWLHMLCSTSLSHLRLGTGRGDIPSGLAGTIVHDCWPPYLALEAVEHGLCNAHLLPGVVLIRLRRRNTGVLAGLPGRLFQKDGDQDAQQAAQHANNRVDVM